ncbi:MAG: hypothetical protein ACYCW6_18775 [Candidatus Xenobia bacterium]
MAGLLPEALGRRLQCNRTFFSLTAGGWALLALVHGQAFFHGGPPYPTQALPQDQHLATALQAGTLLYLFVVLYGRFEAPRPEPVSSRTLVAGLAAIGMLAWLSPPVNSGDILSYLGMGRLAAIYHVSPYEHIYHGIKDAFSPYAWCRDPMPYGPLALLLIYPAGVISGASILASLYFVKFVSLLLHAGSVAVLARMLPDADRHRQRLLLYALNPLILFELVTNGHIEALIVLFECLFLYALWHQKPFRALLAALLSGLVQAPGFFFLGSGIVFSLRRRAYAAVVGSLLAAVAMLAVLRVTIFTGPSGLWVLYPWSHPLFFLHHPHNLPGVLEVPGKTLWSQPVNHAVWSVVQALAGLLGLYWLAQARTRARLVAFMYGSLLLLYLVGTYHFLTWYVTWLLPLPLLLPRRFFRFSLILSLMDVLTMYYVDTPYILALCVLVAWLLYRDDVRKVSLVVIASWLPVAINPSWGLLVSVFMGQVATLPLLGKHGEGLLRGGKAVLGPVREQAVDPGHH